MGEWQIFSKSESNGLIVWANYKMSFSLALELQWVSLWQYPLWFHCFLMAPTSPEPHTVANNKIPRPEKENNQDFSASFLQRAVKFFCSEVNSSTYFCEHINLLFQLVNLAHVRFLSSHQTKPAFFLKRRLQHFLDLLLLKNSSKCCPENPFGCLSYPRRFLMGKKRTCYKSSNFLM